MISLEMYRSTIGLFYTGLIGMVCATGGITPGRNKDSLGKPNCQHPDLGKCIFNFRNFQLLTQDRLPTAPVWTCVERSLVWRM